MQNHETRPVGAGRAIVRAVLLTGAVLLALLWQSAQLRAATIFDVEKTLAAPPTVTPQGNMAVLQNGQSVHHVRIDYLKNLVDAHKRIGSVAKTQANVALAINTQPNAAAIPIAGRNVILISTAMLELIGTDGDMMAALLGHEYAHLYMKHSLKTVMNLPDFVYGAVAVGSQVGTRTGNEKAAGQAARAAFGLMGASFSRQQEVEADRVGTELMSEAKYDPEGTVRLMNAMLKLQGSRPTGYFDSHPGFEERLARAAPTVLNQRFDTVALTLKEQKNWKTLSHTVDHWLKVSPDSARGWYYKGTVLKATKREGSLAAFEKAVAYDPGFEPGRLALCVELHAAGRELESLICSEYLPRGAPQNEYEASTFQHNVYVSGMNDAGRQITALDVLIVQQLMGRKK